MTDDDLLNEALECYSDCQPRAGMEARVLRRVQQQRRAGWWLAGGAIAACLAIAVVHMDERRPVPVVVPRTVVVVTETQKPVDVQKRVEQPGPVRVAVAIEQRRRNRGVKAKPFQVGRPVTQQERALLAFVQSAPPELLQNLAQEQAVPIRLIQIDEIVIKALPKGENE